MREEEEVESRLQEREVIRVLCGLSYVSCR